MKTITTLLMTSFLLVGTFNTVLARNDARSERANSPRYEIKVKHDVRNDRPFNNDRNFGNRESERSNHARYDSRGGNNHVNLRYHERQQRYTLEDLAWLETNRIAVALNLSNHQRNRVFEINYRYITHHHKGMVYSTSRRDREIRQILRLSQIVAFALLLNELHNGDLSYDCSNERY